MTLNPFHSDEKDGDLYICTFNHSALQIEICKYNTDIIDWHICINV
jgi:hypothetical protein